MCVESGAWSCPITSNTFSVITLWGLVGSSRLLGASGEYKNLNWCFLVGALAPIPFWVIAKSSSKLKVVSSLFLFFLFFGFFLPPSLLAKLMELAIFHGFAKSWSCNFFYFKLLPPQLFHEFFVACVFWIFKSHQRNNGTGELNSWNFTFAGIHERSESASAIWSCKSLATGDTSDIQFLVHHRMHFQLLCLQAPKALVATIQLHFVSRSRHWGGFCRSSHLPHPSLLRQRRTKMVG